MTIVKMTGDYQIDPYLFSTMSTNRTFLQNAVKRLFDVAFSFCALIFFTPTLLVIALLVKCSSKGPIFYKCPRIGKHGRIIQCLKFRTMYKNADEKLKKLLLSDVTLREEYEVYHKLKKDPRITNIGKFLRKTSLDELPQFFNVLTGTLSVVGPRPYAPDELDKILAVGSIKIFSVRPGVTGLWQTSGRNLLSFEQRVKLEETYISCQSFRSDVMLILKTIPFLILPKGAF